MPTPLFTEIGLATWLVVHREVDLPAFAAFPLVDDHRRSSASRGQ